jgi:glycerol dehydrogenase-like iron-containing ADH family enzyme
MAVPQICRKLWTAEEVLQLRKLVRQNTPAQVIARKLGRTIDSVYVKASREGISLRLVPTWPSNWCGGSRQSS